MLKADIIFRKVVISPNKTTAAVPKKFIPGKGKNKSNEMIRYTVIEQWKLTTALP